ARVPPRPGAARGAGAPRPGGGWTRPAGRPGPRRKRQGGPRASAEFSHGLLDLCTAALERQSYSDTRKFRSLARPLRVGPVWLPAQLTTIAGELHHERRTEQGSDPAI